MRVSPFLVLIALALAGPAWAEPARPVPGECSGPGAPAPSFCLYRSIVPSAGIVADCESSGSCRVGYYAGDPADAVWFEPPPGTPRLPRPDVIWRLGTLAEVRFDCGAPCTFSYFVEARRRRVSGPWRSVLAVDATRWLFAAVETRALVVRQLFSGRQVARIERDWAPAGWIGESITAARFDPDGRLSLAWLRGQTRAPVHERLSVPSVPR